LGVKNLEVHRNDQINIDEIERFDKIVLSPGPGLPAESGILPELIRRYASSKSILGVCLGQQAIAESFGGSLLNLSNVYHGVSSKIKIVNPDVLFESLPAEIEVGRYHSWVVNPSDLPDVLKVTAVDENGMIMALTHKYFDVRGVQFHPESVLTPMGEQMLKNWLKN
jgi:anthranilate synthase component 2